MLKENNFLVVFADFSVNVEPTSNMRVKVNGQT